MYKSAYLSILNIYSRVTSSVLLSLFFSMIIPIDKNMNSELSRFWDTLWEWYSIIANGCKNFSNSNSFSHPWQSALSTEQTPQDFTNISRFVKIINKYLLIGRYDRKHISFFFITHSPFNYRHHKIFYAIQRVQWLTDD